MKKAKEKFAKKVEKEYLHQYENFLKEVRTETFQSFPKKSQGIIECVNDSIDFFPRGEQEWEQAPHSFSKVLRCYLWKLTSCIAYEILNGKFFEAPGHTKKVLIEILD